jgi:hypothetical protein
MRLFPYPFGVVQAEQNTAPVLRLPFFLFKTGPTYIHVCVYVLIVFLEGPSFDGRIGSRVNMDSHYVRVSEGVKARGLIDTK